ncbi:hypothetical protein GUJ93_ZPchr0011g28177 [Zizania palustris]|uniref:Peptidase A1 domain-containing protein n=1 Tax=Zizania palustris TaxID=103762 RepID=A0A8J6BR31_ZIZPA|nr:hypothetical protein GUJ93_ZPchr0011g28177 [Zizania palustris]
MDLSSSSRCRDHGSVVPCSTSTCSWLALYSYGCSGGQCGYIVSYGDGSNTTGVYSSDTLTLTGSDVLKGFLFGYGHARQGIFSSIDGLLGLGRLGQSLVSQASASYGGVFLYCLPPTPNSVGYLMLGGPSSTSGFSTMSLLLVSNGPMFYIVMLACISVGGQQMVIDASVFSTGAVVDTSTDVTRLPPTAYGALRSTFYKMLSICSRVVSNKFSTTEMNTAKIGTRFLGYEYS